MREIDPKKFEWSPPSSGQSIAGNGAGEPGLRFLLYPCGSNIMDRTVAFRWSPLPSASSYRLFIGDEHTHPIWQSPDPIPASKTEMSFPSDFPPDAVGEHALVRGQIYSWGVEATISEGSKEKRVRSEVRFFRVMNESQYQIAHSLLKTPLQPAEEVDAYERLGMLGDAANEMNTWRFREERSPRADALRRTLRDMYTRMGCPELAAQLSYQRNSQAPERTEKVTGPTLAR